MARLFRQDPDDDLDDADLPDGGAEQPDAYDLNFAVIVSEASTDGWHMAAVIGESANLDFYVRALTVRWPFVIARPMRSNRSNDKIIDPKHLSPAGTSPARKLVVNWAWEPVEPTIAQLRFFAKRTGPAWFGSPSRLTARLTLKESAWPRRRTVTKVKSNPIAWESQAEDDGEVDD